MNTPSTKLWEFGDKVVHTAKPEWGAGVVTGAQSTVQDGRPCQSLTIRFDRAGIKTLSTAFARLIPADPALIAALSTPADDAVDSGPTEENSATNLLNETTGLGRRDPKEVMTRLPEITTDPFTTPAARLRATLHLYRFTPTGASLLDWAAAQSGLSDPLNRFNRHELERFFDAFVVVRDAHLKKLVVEMKRSDPAGLAQALTSAPPSAQQAMRRLDAHR